LSVNEENVPDRTELIPSIDDPTQEEQTLASTPDRAAVSEPIAGFTAWKKQVCEASQTLASLYQNASSDGSSGYQHTLQEILQQPITWRETASTVIAESQRLSALVGKEKPTRVRSVLLTGSGSSLYVGDCVKRYITSQLQVPAEAVSGGALLLSAHEPMLPSPRLMVSIARSGDSPESVAAVDALLEAEPDSHHLMVTCNRYGRLATDYVGHPRVTTLVLPDATCDKSLVMTSSFTSMAVACRGFADLNRLGQYRQEIDAMASVAEGMLKHHFDEIFRLGALDYSRAVFLGSRSRYGAAREAALKMLEMTEGRVATMSESFLGLRHGPMSFVREDTLVVCFLSSDPAERSYELDLVRELDSKKLGARRIIVGGGLDRVLDVQPKGDPNRLCITWDGQLSLGLDGEVLPGVLVGQLLGFSRCMAEGLNPDAPSPAGVIGRVVGAFPIHRSGNAKNSEV
jgi:tagatose-6-phosphate ketose/aldose isomerase